MDYVPQLSEIDPISNEQTDAHTDIQHFLNWVLSGRNVLFHICCFIDNHKDEGLNHSGGKNHQNGVAIGLLLKIYHFFILINCLRS